MPIWMIHTEHGRHPAPAMEVPQFEANGWKVDKDRLDMDRLKGEEHIGKTITLKKGKK
jgi:hypothetical protein